MSNPSLPLLVCLCTLLLALPPGGDNQCGSGLSTPRRSRPPSCVPLHQNPIPTSFHIDPGAKSFIGSSTLVIPSSLDGFSFQPWSPPLWLEPLSIRKGDGSSSITAEISIKSSSKLQSWRWYRSGLIEGWPASVEVWSACGGWDWRPGEDDKLGKPAIESDPVTQGSEIIFVPKEESRKPPDFMVAVSFCRQISRAWVQILGFEIKLCLGLVPRFGARILGFRVRQEWIMKPARMQSVEDARRSCTVRVMMTSALVEAGGDRGFPARVWGEAWVFGPGSTLTPKISQFLGLGLIFGPNLNLT